MRDKAFGHDYEVIGNKIAEMVGNLYEHEIKVRDDEIERLRQRNAELVEALVEAVAYVPRADWHYMTKETRAAIAKATGGE